MVIILSGLLTSLSSKNNLMRLHEIFLILLFLAFPTIFISLNILLISLQTCKSCSSRRRHKKVIVIDIQIINYDLLLLPTNTLRCYTMLDRLFQIESCSVVNLFLNSCLPQLRLNIARQPVLMDVLGELGWRLLRILI